MHITFTNTGKRYNREWIFRDVNYFFSQGKTYAITGPNGSGKSTLLQVIGGALMHNEGKIAFELDGQTIDEIQHYKYISIAAPYLELVEEFTANESLAFHAQFKSLALSAKEILSIVGLSHAADKQIRYYSSGMKQRLKLAQAFFSDSAVLLLDEPATNLDDAGIGLYKQLIRNYTANRIVIVSSNDRQEYDFCENVININDYK